MHPTMVAAALTVAMLLSMPAIAGSAEPLPVQGNASHAHRTASDSDPAARALEGVTIERTLGDGLGETIIVRQGAAVRLVLHAPAGTELHMHGYDLAGTAGRDMPVVMTFSAHRLGRFPIEVHGIEDVLGRKEKVLAYIEVRAE